MPIPTTEPLGTHEAANTTAFTEAINVDRRRSFIGRTFGRLLGRSDFIPIAEGLPITNIAANIEDYINFYRQPSTKSDEEIEEAKEVISADNNLSEDIGFEPTRFKQTTNHGEFLKENDPDLSSMTGNFFHVVVDKADAPWLLKYAGKTSKRTGRADIFHEIYTWQRSEEEVLAYQFAKYLGYPVPETKIVTPHSTGDEILDGRPYLAYRYLDSALDHDLYFDDPGHKTISTVRHMITNQHDVDFRQVFNWAIGSFGDGATQGIVDQKNGTYYAQDLNTSYKLPYMSIDKRYPDFESAIEDAISGHGGLLPSGLSPFITDENSTKVSGYFEKLRSLSMDTVEAIIKPRTPKNIAEKDSLCKAIVERAAVLVRLFDEGRFEKK